MTYMKIKQKEYPDHPVYFLWALEGPPEEWRPIPGYEGLYDVSDLGRVRRIAQRRTGVRLKYPKHLSPAIGSWGYRVCGMCKGGKTKSYNVHILVLMAFRGKKPSNKSIGNHKDGNKENNVLANLEWATQSQNQIHSYRILGRKSGVIGPKNPQARASTADVAAARKMLTDGVGKHEVAKTFGHSWQWANALSKGTTRIHGL